MDEYSFEGRVAVVTGAGRGIGRAYARLLAERGASVVVNDLGGSMEGAGADAGPASTVAAEIVAAGGAAVADTSDVASPDGAQTLVDTAVERFGRIDILVNNAGIIRWAGLPEADADNLASHLAVHVGGSFNTTRAAWPHMVEQGYGRIVMTSSRGCSGSRPTSRTPPPRPRVIGLTRSLADRRRRARHQGQPHRARGDDAHGRPGRRRLVRRDADVARPRRADGGVPRPRGLSGQRRDLRRRRGSLRPHLHRLRPRGTSTPTPTPTVEDVAEHWAAINDETGYYVPADLMDWSNAFLAHQSG